MTVQIRKGKKVEASGDTVQEALWELRRTRPDDLHYPVIDEGSGQITGVHVRTGDDKMTVLVMEAHDDAV